MGITIDPNIGINKTIGDVGRPTKTGSAAFAEKLAEGAKVAAVTTAGMAAGPIGSAVVSKLLGGNQDQGEMMNSMMKSNMDLLQLQMQIQNISQTFQTQSNIMKTDHDARMSSIRNIKG
ncbi:MAG: hypothetical protein AB1414_00345 [bacterium]